MYLVTRKCNGQLSCINKRDAEENISKSLSLSAPWKRPTCIHHEHTKNDCWKSRSTLSATCSWKIVAPGQLSSMPLHGKRVLPDLCNFHQLSTTTSSILLLTDFGWTADCGARLVIIVQQLLPILRKNVSLKMFGALLWKIRWTISSNGKHNPSDPQYNTSLFLERWKQMSYAIDVMRWQNNG